MGLLPGLEVYTSGSDEEGPQSPVCTTPLAAPSQDHAAHVCLTGHPPHNNLPITASLRGHEASFPKQPQPCSLTLPRQPACNLSNVHLPLESPAIAAPLQNYAARVISQPHLPHNNLIEAKAAALARIALLEKILSGGKTARQEPVDPAKTSGRLDGGHPSTAQRGLAGNCRQMTRGTEEGAPSVLDVTSGWQGLAGSVGRCAGGTEVDDRNVVMPSMAAETPLRRTRIASAQQGLEASGRNAGGMMGDERAMGQPSVAADSPPEATSIEQGLTGRSDETSSAQPSIAVALPPSSRESTSPWQELAGASKRSEGDAEGNEIAVAHPSMEAGLPPEAGSVEQGLSGRRDKTSSAQPNMAAALPPGGRKSASIRQGLAGGSESTAEKPEGDNIAMAHPSMEAGSPPEAGSIGQELTGRNEGRSTTQPSVAAVLPAGGRESASASQGLSGNSRKSAGGIEGDERALVQPSLLSRLLPGARDKDSTALPTADGVQYSPNGQEGTVTGNESGATQSAPQSTTRCESAPVTAGQEAVQQQALLDAVGSPTLDSSTISLTERQDERQSSGDPHHLHDSPTVKAHTEFPISLPEALLLPSALEKIQPDSANSLQARATSPPLQEAPQLSGQIAERDSASDEAPPREGTLAWILAKGARSEVEALHCQGGGSLEELETELRLPVALSRDDMLSLRTELAKGVILMRYGSSDRGAMAVLRLAMHKLRSNLIPADLVIELKLVELLHMLTSHPNWLVKDAAASLLSKDTFAAAAGMLQPKHGSDTATPNGMLTTPPTGAGDIGNAHHGAPTANSESRAPISVPSDSRASSQRASSHSRGTMPQAAPPEQKAPQVVDTLTPRGPQRPARNAAKRARSQSPAPASSVGAARREGQDIAIGSNGGRRRPSQDAEERPNRTGMEPYGNARGVDVSAMLQSPTQPIKPSAAAKASKAAKKKGAKKPPWNKGMRNGKPAAWQDESQPGTHDASLSMPEQPLRTPLQDAELCMANGVANGRLDLVPPWGNLGPYDAAMLQQQLDMAASCPDTPARPVGASGLPHWQLDNVTSVYPQPGILPIQSGSNLGDLPTAAPKSLIAPRVMDWQPQGDSGDGERGLMIREGAQPVQEQQFGRGFNADHTLQPGGASPWSLFYHAMEASQGQPGQLGGGGSGELPYPSMDRLTPRRAIRNAGTASLNPMMLPDQIANVNIVSAPLHFEPLHRAQAAGLLGGDVARTRTESEPRSVQQDDDATITSPPRRFQAVLEQLFKGRPGAESLHLHTAGGIAPMDAINSVPTAGATMPMEAGVSAPMEALGHGGLAQAQGPWGYSEAVTGRALLRDMWLGATLHTACMGMPMQASMVHLPWHRQRLLPPTSPDFRATARYHLVNLQAAFPIPAPVTF